MSKYVDPMPAGVRVRGDATTIYECTACHEASHYPKSQYPDEGGFLALYARLQQRAWDHNMRVHIRPHVTKASKPELVTTGEQLLLF